MDKKDEPIKPRLTIEYPPLDAPYTPPLQVVTINGEPVPGPIQGGEAPETSEHFLKELLGMRTEKPVAIKTERGWKEVVQLANDAPVKKGPRGI